MTLFGSKVFADIIKVKIRTFFPGGISGGKKKKKQPATAGVIRDMGSIPGLGRSPGEGNGNPLQYSCLENPYGQRSLESYSP